MWPHSSQERRTLSAKTATRQGAAMTNDISSRRRLMEIHHPCRKVGEGLGIGVKERIVSRWEE